VYKPELATVATALGRVLGPQPADLPWLWGYDPQALAHAVTARMMALEQQAAQTPCPRILLVTGDPLAFWAGFLGALAVPSVLFLGNPAWGSAEWHQVLTLAQPQVIWGDYPRDRAAQPGDRPWDRWQYWDQSYPCDRPVPALAPGWILIPTGGTSGRLRFVIHTEASLRAAVGGLQRSGLVSAPGQIHSFCTLPWHHVSGLMQGLRSLFTGGQLISLSFKTLEQQIQDCPEPLATYPLSSRPFFLSLVPTQLQRLLQHPQAVPGLTQFQAIFLGGAPPWPALLDRGRALQLPLAPTYGMTETAAQIATLNPVDFLGGQGGCGQVLPHGQVQVVAGDQGLPPGAVGQIQIRSASLALGYYSLDPKTQAPRLDRWSASPFQPDDLGIMDSMGCLQVVGRSSDKIITGGENVFPVEVESAIRGTGLVADVAVLGMPDALWGEAVVAVYGPVEAGAGEGLGALRRILRSQMAPHKCPKYWLKVDLLPRNDQGKIDRQRLKALVELQHLDLRDTPS